MKTFNDILVDVGEYTLNILSFLVLTKLCYDLLCAMSCNMIFDFNLPPLIEFTCNDGYFSERS